MGSPPWFIYLTSIAESELRLKLVEIIRRETSFKMEFIVRNRTNVERERDFIKNGEENVFSGNDAWVSEGGADEHGDGENEEDGGE